MRRLALAVLSLAFLVACQPATTELTEEQKAEIAAEVNTINGEMWDAWRETDFDRGMSYFYNSAELMFATNGAVTHGYADVEATFRPSFASVASQDITFTDSRTTVLALDAVCLMEAGTYTVTDTAGATTLAAQFAITSIWMLRDGEWKLSIVHESFPPTEGT